jgi:hypothetical protein
MPKQKKIGRQQVCDFCASLFVYTSFQLEAEQKAGNRWTPELLEQVNGNFLKNLAFCYKRFVKPCVPAKVGVFLEGCFYV